MSDQPTFDYGARDPGRRAGDYNPAVDLIRSTYVGRHREPEVVVDIAEARQKRRQRKEKKP